MIHSNAPLKKKERILQAAATIMARKGYAAALMSEIAEEAGIGKGTIYEYFRSKEDLFFAVFEWFFQQSAAAATVSISALGGSVSQRIFALGESVMTYWVDQMDSFSLVMEFWSASASSKIRDRFKTAFRNGYQEFRRLLGGLIREGIRQGEFRPDTDVDAVAASLVGTWDALLLQRWFDTAFDPLSVSRQFLDVVLRGMSTKTIPLNREEK